MKTNKNGFAIVTALGLLMIIMIIVGIMAASSVAESKQNSLNILIAQTREMADAGDTYATSAIRGEAQKQIGEVINDLIVHTSHPERTWQIPKNKWSQATIGLEAVLNNYYSSLDNVFHDSSEVSITYEINNFRGSRKNARMQTYLADYKIISNGRIMTDNGAIKAQRTIEDRGVFEISLGFTAISKFLFLVDDAGGNFGFFPTGTVFNGPAHSNDAWGFAGTPRFLDDASTASTGAIYWDLRHNCPGSTKLFVNGDSRPPCSVPEFAKGFRKGPENYIDLPTNSVSQARAALGLDPNTQAPIPAADAPNSDGVYLANSGGRISGGIYVRGDVEELKVDGSNNTQQYCFKQIVGGVSTETCITLNYLNDTTRIIKKNLQNNQILVDETYSGLPNGAMKKTDPFINGSPDNANGQIYVSGKIKNLKAPNRTGTVSNAQDHPPSNNIPPALAWQTQLNITANNEIKLTSDLVYECDPTMLGDADYINQKPQCNMSSEELPTVLGMMSLQDEIQITTQTPDDLYLWGSYFAGTNGKGLTVQNYNSRGAQGTLRLFGGLIQQQDQLRGVWGWNGLRSGYVETFDYDRRFKDGRISPPNFPTFGDFSFERAVPSQLSYKEF